MMGYNLYVCVKTYVHVYNYVVGIYVWCWW